MAKSAKSRVKGLTIEINGSTTGLDKALGKMNSTIGNSQAKLRDLDKLLKLDPKNTELLEQKQRALKDAIGATKDKLETLKKAQEEAKQQLADGKIGQDQYDALAREIADCEQSLKKLEEEAGKVQAPFQTSAQEAKKSIEEIGKEIEATGGKLKEVDELLKLDPSNTELLKQKQEYLAQSIDATKEKLEREKEALDQLKNSDGFDASSESAKELERQIIADEQALKKLQDEAKALPSHFQASMQEAGKKVKEVGDKIEEVGGKITDIGKGMSTNVTAPIVAAGGASVAAWKEVDEAMDTVIKKTGASGDALGDMQQRVKNLAESIPTDFQTAADAVGEVNTRFGLTGDALEDLSGQFIKFAELNETDVSSSVDKVQSAMAAWNIPAEEAGKVLDTINKAGQDTGINIDRLTDLMKTNKTALDEAGMSFSDSAMFLANLDKNGIDAGTALTGLKKALQNATKDGKTSAQALDELQATMGDGSNKAEAYAAATDLFGAKAGPAIADACMEGRLSFDELGTSMADFAGNVESTFNETLDPLDQMQMSMNTMKDLGAEIVESAAPMITEAMTAIRDVVTELKEKWDGLDEGQQEQIIKMALVAAAIGPVIVVIGTLVTSIGGVISTIGGVMTAIAGLSPPILIAIGVIGALVAAGVWLYQNWDMVREKAGELVETIKQKWNDFKEATVQKFTEIKEGAQQKIQDMKDAVNEKIDSLKEGAQQKIQDMKDFIGDKFGAIADTAQDIFDRVKGFIEDPIGSAKDFVRNAIEDIKDYFHFEWHLPDLKLPHINVGRYIDIPVLGTVPDPRYMSVDWYAKAMQGGMILDSPTIFGMQGGKFLAGGEAGKEAVIGTNSLQSMIASAVRAGGGQTINYGGIEIVVNAPAGMDIRALAEEIEDRINANVTRRRAGFA